MIARDSTSYPYLAVAQHCGVSYNVVLKFADIYDSFVADGQDVDEGLIILPVARATFTVWRREQRRRLAVS